MFLLAGAAFRHIDHSFVIRQFLKWHIPPIIHVYYKTIIPIGWKGKSGKGTKYVNML